MSWHNLLLDSYKFNCSFMHIFLYYSAVYFKDWTFIFNFLSFVFSEQEKRLVNLFIVTSRKTAGFSRYSDDKTCTDPTKALKPRQRCMSLFHANGLKDGDAVVQRLASLAHIPRGPGPFLRLQVLPGPAGVPVGSSHRSVRRICNPKMTYWGECEWLFVFVSWTFDEPGTYPGRTPSLAVGYWCAWNPRS